MSVLKTTGSFGYNAICDVCGYKFKASMLRKRWDGYMVCNKDYETRQPLDFYTTRNDTHLLPWTRRDSGTVDVSPQSRLTNWGLSSNGATATASSTRPGLYTWYMNDGITYSNTFAWVDNQANVFPKWVRISLTSPQMISKVVLIGPQDTFGISDPVDPLTNSLTGALYSAKDFTIQVREESTGNYIQVARVSGNNLVAKEVLFAPVYTQTILINVTSTWRTDGLLSLLEVQVWGSGTYGGGGFDPPLPSTAISGAAIAGYAIAGLT